MNHIKKLLKAAGGEKQHAGFLSPGDQRVLQVIRSPSPCQRWAWRHRKTQ